MVRCILRGWALGIGILTLGAPVSGIADEDRHGESEITCVNPASGASWRVKIDYERSTADSYPARISERQVSWRDTADGGNYTLDRKSGELTVIVASSTGGYFLHHRCKLQN